MDIHREAQLQTFVAVYGQLAVDAVRSYREGKRAYIILADVTDDVPIRPGMKNVTTVHEEDFQYFDLELITVRMALQQFRSCDKRQQCVIGIRFPDGNLYTHVVQIKKKSPN
tara:strand:+ start:589 stop:924 length:336 start_codon:yes stop_codon:yes gene_type:complete